MKKFLSHEDLWSFFFFAHNKSSGESDITLRFGYCLPSVAKKKHNKWKRSPDVISNTLESDIFKIKFFYNPMHY